jgi:hypothetical protein
MTGQRMAYAALVGDGGYIIGRADENVDGYTPLDKTFGVFTTYEEARSKAAELNVALGLTPPEAAEIVLSTMRNQIKARVSKGRSSALGGQLDPAA